jgi:hypothetical protein
MDQSLGVGRFLRRFFCCTAAGAGVVIFAKPLVLMAVVVGVCAAIGFLLWLPLRTVFAVGRNPWQKACGYGRRWLDPVRHKCRQTADIIRNLVERTTPVVSGLLLEGVSGAVVALVLAVAVGAHNKAIPAAALSGALAGALLALTRSRQESNSLQLQTEAGLDQGPSLSRTQPPSSERR